MNKLLFISIIISSFCSSYECNKSKSGSLKGKLVVKELCLHYVVQIIDGKVDSSKVVNDWKDDKRGTFNKVFTVANRCDFPAGLNEGDEFEFSFDPNPPPQNCMMCMAYYPTPAKANAIKIEQGK
jgi:hypothetical protein